jgi:hypothetical protein
MGQQYSHMNLWALSSIVRCDRDLPLHLYKAYEEKYVNPNLAAFEVNDADFEEILDAQQLYYADKDVCEDIFHLLDVRSRGISNIRDVCISLTPIVAKSIHHMFTMCFEILDRKKEFMVGKDQVTLMLKLLSATCGNVGDKPLAPEVLDDYVNSLYTSAGLIDGSIYYPDYVETLCIHPIIELFLSPQFQGPVTSKLMSDEEIDRLHKLDFDEK